MWSCFWFVYNSYKGVKTKEIHKVFHRGVYFLILAIGVWLFDSNFCYIYHHVPNPQLHAW